MLLLLLLLLLLLFTQTNLMRKLRVGMRLHCMRLSWTWWILWRWRALSRASSCWWNLNHIKPVLRPSSHRTRKHIWSQICLQRLLMLPVSCMNTSVCNNICSIVCMVSAARCSASFIKDFYWLSRGRHESVSSSLYCRCALIGCWEEDIGFCVLLCSWLAAERTHRILSSSHQPKSG